MSDIYLDETIIYSADVWPSVAVGMPEVQAHAMSCPVALYGESVDKYDADRVVELQAEVQRLSAELAHRTQVWEGEEWKLRGELSDARADVERLEQRFRRITFTENEAGDLVLISEQDEDGQILRVLWERKERLRKEREDVRTDVGIVVSDGFHSGKRRGVGGNFVRADGHSALDHRLGLPPPDGDPVAPMSARKPYRWGMV